MSRWTTINEDDLRAAAFGDILDSARATPVGAVDPVERALASGVARVRAAMYTGNRLDADTAKVPISLRELAVRQAAFALSSLIGFALSEDQRDDKKNDNSYLLRITDQKIAFEPPDVPADATTVATKPTMETVQDGNTGSSREDLKGL